MNTFFNIAFYYSLISGTLFLCLVLGKFFCVSFIENFYNRLNDELDGVLIGFLICSFFIQILYIIVYFTDVQILKLLIGYFGGLISVLTLCCFLLHIMLVYIVPGLENIHKNIKSKKNRGC